MVRLDPVHMSALMSLVPQAAANTQTLGMELVVAGGVQKEGGKYHMLRYQGQWPMFVVTTPTFHALAAPCPIYLVFLGAQSQPREEARNLSLLFLTFLIMAALAT